MRPILALACVAALAGCTAGCSVNMHSASSALAAGQLYCQVRGEAVALQIGTGQAILAQGADKAAVDAACAAAGGIAISPPADGKAGTVTIALPPSVTVPLG